MDRGRIQGKSRKKEQALFPALADLTTTRATNKYIFQVELDKLVKEKEAIAVGFFSDLESSWAATKLFREVVVVIKTLPEAQRTQGIAYKT